MDTKTKLSQALKEALKAKDERRKRVVRMAMSAIKNAEVAQKGELTEPDVLAIVQKEVKARHETIEGARQAKRDDLIAEAEAETHHCTRQRFRSAHSQQDMRWLEATGCARRSRTHGDTFKVQRHRYFISANAMERNTQRIR